MRYIFHNLANESGFGLFALRPTETGLKCSCRDLRVSLACSRDHKTGVYLG